jgi:hypothetical protein
MPWLLSRISASWHELSTGTPDASTGFPAQVQGNRDHAAELTIMLLVSAREESFDLAWSFLKSPAS